jgi:calcineurin B family protein 1
LLTDVFVFSEEQLSIIADKTISEADINGDGLISFEEFSKTFEKSDIEHKMSIRFLN